MEIKTGTMTTTETIAGTIITMETTIIGIPI
jgi:hypothetical protein